MSLLLNGIVMWGGNIGELPTGWVLCDGNNGTPNLQNRFIIGAGSNFNFNATGGSANTAVASHGHTLSGTTNTISAISHNHPMGTLFTQAGPTIRAVPGTGTNKTTNAGGAHAHGVTVTAAGIGENGVGKNLPPYYTLAFIMQIT